MKNYYETLRVSNKSSAKEIKSAYRKLAQELHPDKNSGSQAASLAFSHVAKAYEVLINPTKRAAYDKKLRMLSADPTLGDSVLDGSNSHAKRWRQFVYEHRYNEVIDRMIAKERQESIALQKIIFPTVALFISALAVGILKPKLFADSAMIGKIILISLFVVGVIHLFSRIHEALEKYTYRDSEIHESIFDGIDQPHKPFSRIAAGLALAVGFAVALGVGVFIGSYVNLVPRSGLSMFSTQLGPEVLFYPPIFVLFADILYGFALKIDI